MSRLIKLACIPALAFALVVMTGQQQAEAGGFSIRIGNSGYGSYYGGYGRSYGYSRGRAYLGRSYYPGYRSYRSYRPHYDYHPPSLVPHRGHFDYVPGHYDFHSGGRRGGHPHGHHGHH
ncbi:hypothetical protein NHH03_22550 [Stieleria sp. TO1_6]|uniref:hypothetical protein n=1 Tax=Stieleria tagensis TaxID=2956795 RepID=UPI00209B42C4|nr:hypothetical protein [Stieleria tagensis]MCO8124537.1 hypothetical protein [Stieleria tagensis]